MSVIAATTLLTTFRQLPSSRLQAIPIRPARRSRAPRPVQSVLSKTLPHAQTPSTNASLVTMTSTTALLPMKAKIVAISPRSSSATTSKFVATSLHNILLISPSKYIDSHLKPFRCKHSTCIEVQFSSTACLLRHEREAHGMHGHGSKPNLCLYPDCERSQPGNGFPRRYNLYDHMRRVHDYSGPTTSPEGIILPDALPPPAKKERKRRISSEDVPTLRLEKKAKVRPLMAPQTGLSKRDRESPNLLTQWEEKRTTLQLRLETVNPQDLEALQVIIQEAGALQRLSQELLGPG